MILLYISLFWLIFSSISIISDLNLDINYNNVYLLNKNVKLDLKSSKSWNLTGTSIYINDKDPTCNWSKTANENGWCTGLGTWKDPYTIENVIIDMKNNSANCLTIINSSVPYIIRNCHFYNSRSYEYLDNPYWYLEGGGIMLYNVSNGLITRNNCSSNTFGILAYGLNNSINENSIVNNDNGIICYGYDNIISINTVTKNGFGILIGGMYNIVSLNKVNKSEYYGIWAYGSDLNSISENSVSFNNRTGIFLEECMRTSIYKNECTNNKMHGIYIDGSMGPYFNGELYPSEGNNWVSGNQANNNLYGIKLNYTENEHIINNTINNNEFSGIDLYESNYNSILNNKINGNEFSGINLYESDYSSILNNKINGSYYGINLNQSRFIEIIQNSINNSFYGISLTSSDFNTISFNVIYYNKICFIEHGECYGNIYEDNDCIKLKDKKQDWTLLIIITVSASLTIAVIIFIFLLYRRRISS